MIKAALTVLLISLLMCTSAFAGGSGNCVQPLKTTTDDLGVGGAFEYNYVHKRMNDLNNKKGPKSMKIEHLNQVYGKVIFGAYDDFNIYGKIGGCNYDLEFVDRAQDAKMEIDLKSGIYTGAGINGLFPLMDTDNLSIGFDVQGNFFYNDVKGITRSGQSGTAIDGAFYGIDGQESVYLTYKFDIDEIETLIVPYMGVYHSWIIVGTAEALTYETPKTGYVDKEHFQAAFDVASFGLLLGVDVDIAKYVNLNVEGRFIGETAITTGATIKF
ncbi:MAG: hypothetical protein KAU58_02590 [Candidatus Omnitrophica bacterium]|nr:hypothetical protein [Candidatus Omnitrophota bacterium]